jgi:hypothetical protein
MRLLMVLLRRRLVAMLLLLMLVLVARLMLLPRVMRRVLLRHVLLRRVLLMLRMLLISLRNWRARVLHDGLVEPLPDGDSGLARGFPCGVADFRPHTFHVPRDALPHALTQTRPAAGMDP